MKISSLIRHRRFATCALAIATIGLPFTALRAHEDHDHGASPAASAPAGDAWKNAQASLLAIQTGAKAKDQGTIHTEQEKLAAALKQLQEQGGGADKARLEGAIKNAIAASEKVHVAADAKDFAKVDSSLKTLEATMALVEKQLSASTK